MCAFSAPRGALRAALRTVAATLFLLASPAVPARAHHGRDFLLAQTADLPHRRQLFLIARQDWNDEGEERELELEPTVLFGLVDRLTLELHAHIARPEGESFEHESTAPALHLRLTPPASAWGLALSAEYEVAQAEEDADRAEAALVLSRQQRALRWAVNLRAEEEQADEAEVEWGYAAGLRARVRQGVDWGLELAGGFSGDAEEEALVGLHFEPAERWTVQVGAGTGIGGEGPDWTLRTAVVWQAR